MKGKITQTHLAIAICIAISVAITAASVLYVNGFYAMRENAWKEWAITEVYRGKQLPPGDVPCDPQVDLRTSELCAQWKAADAAATSANWAIVTAITSMITLIVTAVSIYFIWGSLSASRHSLDNTRRQNIQEFRAYLRFDFAEFTEVGFNIAIPTITVTNYGRTEAWNLRGSYSLMVTLAQRRPEAVFIGQTSSVTGDVFCPNQIHNGRPEAIEYTDTFINTSGLLRARAGIEIESAVMTISGTYIDFIGSERNFVASQRFSISIDGSEYRRTFRPVNNIGEILIRV
ncbi:hypothetical protein OVA03_00545 [Asticcacaulis sp. SL142]|uniref:hypothetical protein n=1 Tax=Asticcacaulis sp. SL142 TaxID=2995155 RepID=UPI00226CFE5F|nr:hypothetical protein [Asticcacaulis sp. SL142]WAC48456.1 hypothetical protein OVA03_00545 [Asticcacaulis sp. SL142]